MKVFDIYEDKEYYYFVVELVSGGTLLDYLNNQVKFESTAQHESWVKDVVR